MQVSNSQDQTFYTGLGKQAADAFVEAGVNMNTTISKLAAEHSLSTEQVRRVVEAANNAAFGALFSKEAGYVTFPVADVQQIRGGERRIIKLAEERPHPLAGVPTEQLAVQLFGATCLEKVAEPERPLDMVDVIHRTRHAADAVEDAKIDALQKLAGLQSAALRLVEVEDAGTGDVKRALRVAGYGEKLADLACVKIASAQGKVSQFTDAVRVNREHPLLEKAAAFHASLEAYVAEKNKFAAAAKEILHAAKP